MNTILVFLIALVVVDVYELYERRREKGKVEESLQPLPVGVEEFDAWADRIIELSELPAEPSSMKFALASMIMHLGPQECFKKDSFFANSLRKAASNQVCYDRMEAYRAAVKAKFESKDVPSEVPQNTTVPKASN